MAGLGDSLETAGSEFDAGAAPVRARVQDAVDAAGEFSDSLGLGAATFALSWTTAFRAYSSSCRLLADHVGSSSLQLQWIDDEGADSVGGGS